MPRRPLEDVQVHVVDRHERLAPLGVVLVPEGVEVPGLELAAELARPA